MPYQTITLSSVGTSAPAALNWRGGKPSTVVVSAASSQAAGDFYVQFTLDDLQLVGGTSLAKWFGFSSNTYSVENAPALHYNASAVFPGSSNAECVFIPLPSPIGAVRINSSGISAGSLVMKVIQGEGW